MRAPYTEVNELANEVLKCKHYRSHAWDENPTVDLTGLETVKFATHVIASVCVRCGRERIEYIDRHGHRIGGLYYRSPIDYPRTHQLGGDVLRIELIRRSLLIHRLNDRKR